MNVYSCTAASSAASSFADDQDYSSASLPQRLRRALMTWQHPSAAMPAAAVAAVAASKQGAAFLEEHKEQWRESFRSVYMAVQSGCCHCFYFVTPQVSSLLKKASVNHHAADILRELPVRSASPCNALTMCMGV